MVIINNKARHWCQTQSRCHLSFLCAVLIQEQLMELDSVLPLKALLKTSSPESAVTLLSALSAHPPNNVWCVSSNHLMSEKVTADVRQLFCLSPSIENVSVIWFQDVLVSEGVLDEIGQLLHHHRSSSVIITHSCKIIADLCRSCMGQQVQQGYNSWFHVTSLY